MLVQRLPDAEPRNLTQKEQPLLMGFFSTIFLKTLSSVEGRSAQGECLITAYQPK